MPRKKARPSRRGINLKRDSISWVLFEHADKTPTPSEGFAAGDSLQIKLSTSAGFDDWEALTWQVFGNGRYLLAQVKAKRDVQPGKGDGKPPAVKAGPGAGPELTVTVVVDGVASDVPVDPYSE